MINLFGAHNSEEVDLEVSLIQCNSCICILTIWWMLRHDVLWEKEEVNVVRFAFWRLHEIDGVSHPGLFFHHYLYTR